jgi:hypothetical protein
MSVRLPTHASVLQGSKQLRLKWSRGSERSASSCTTSYWSKMENFGSLLRLRVSMEDVHASQLGGKQ